MLRTIGSAELFVRCKRRVRIQVAIDAEARLTSPFMGAALPAIPSRVRPGAIE